MRRIAVAGFQHETNTFGATLADLGAFEMADSWPPLLRGGDVISGTWGNSLPIAGFIRAAQEHPNWEIVPLLWCSAEPSSYVTDEAFDQITSEIIALIQAAGPIDALYLDLHGAMVTQSFEDGEGAFLARVRAHVGDDLPIVVSLDLHANVTQKMVDLATAITMFRTYPHLDMAETGARAAQVLEAVFEGTHFHSAFVQGSYLIALHAQFTGDGAGQAIYDAAMALAPKGGWCEVAMGFPSADIYDAGPSVLCYAPQPAAAAQSCAALSARLAALEPEFVTPLVMPDDAAERAIASGAPIVLADVQDNAGGGASSDTTGVAHALHQAGARGALIGMVHDAPLAALAHQEGAGAFIQGALGGRIDGLDPPVVGTFEVMALSDGVFDFTGQMYAGCTAQTGPTAWVRLVAQTSDVHFVISSVRCQALDRAVFEHIGIDLKEFPILSVKSTVHYRADFDPLGYEIVPVKAAGLMTCDLAHVRYRNLRPSLRSTSSN